MKLAALLEQDHRSLLKQWIGAGTSYREDPDDMDAEVESVQQALENRIQNFASAPVYAKYDVASYDYEIQDVPPEKITVVHQSEDDYNNSSMEYMAKQMKQPQYSQLGRKHDVLPVLLGNDFSVLDGHHRVAANKVNGSNAIPALVPVKPGTGKVINVLQYATQ